MTKLCMSVTVIDAVMVKVLTRCGDKAAIWVDRYISMLSSSSASGTGSAAQDIDMVSMCLANLRLVGK